MIPRHAAPPPLPACPLSHRPHPGPHPIRPPAPSRGAGAASPAPRSGAEGRQASLAAGGSPPARRPEPALAAIELGCSATQTGDPAPLAPRAGPSQVGRLCRTPTTTRFCPASRATGASLEARSGEPTPRPLLIFSARHLAAAFKEFLIHYHHARPHQCLDQRCPDADPVVVPLPVGG